MENEKIEKCAGCEGDCTECGEFDNVVVFEDGEGNEVAFNIEDWTEYDGKRYVALTIVEPTEYFDADSVMIAVLDDEGEELLPVEDDDLAAKVYNQMIDEAEAMVGEDA